MYIKIYIHVSLHIHVHMNHSMYTFIQRQTLLAACLGELRQEESHRQAIELCLLALDGCTSNDYSPAQIGLFSPCVEHAPHLHTRTQTYTHTHTDTHIHIDTHTHTHAHAHTRAHVHTHTHTHTHTCTHMHAHTHTHTHTHTHAHTHIHTPSRSSLTPAQRTTVWRSAGRMCVCVCVCVRVCTHLDILKNQLTTKWTV